MRVEIEKIRISGDVSDKKREARLALALKRKSLRGCASCSHFTPIPVANGADGEGRNGCPKSNGYWKFDCKFHKDTTW